MSVVVSVVTEGPTDTPAILSGTASFTCTATGIPLPTIIWIDQDGNIVGTTSDMVINGGTAILSTLTLSNLQDDDFDNYTCTASNIFNNDDVTALLGSELLHLKSCVIKISCYSDS